MYWRVAERFEEEEIELAAVLACGNGILKAVDESTDEQLFQLVATDVLAQEAAARDTAAVVAAPHRDATVSVLATAVHPAIWYNVCMCYVVGL